MALGETVLDRNIPADDEARLLQSVQERGPERRLGLRRAAAEIADDQQARLRARGEGPRGHPASEKRYDIAASHAWPLELAASADYGSTESLPIRRTKGGLPPQLSSPCSALATAELGHEDQFRPPSRSDRCRFGEATLARTQGNGRDAPKAVINTGVCEPRGSTISSSIRSPPSLPDGMDPGHWVVCARMPCPVARPARVGYEYQAWLPDLMSRIRPHFHLRREDIHHRGLICTVAVCPATSLTPSGTSSMWMRTGMRWARRTQVKIGLTVARPCPLGCAFATLMPRARLATWPRTIWSSPMSLMLAGAPSRIEARLVSSK